MCVKLIKINGLEKKKLYSTSKNTKEKMVLEALNRYKEAFTHSKEYFTHWTKKCDFYTIDVTIFAF